MNLLFSRFSGNSTTNENPVSSEPRWIHSIVNLGHRDHLTYGRTLVMGMTKFSSRYTLSYRSRNQLCNLRHKYTL